MIEDVVDVDPKILAAFDDIIDVRSPAEFAEDRVPGAINLPVLSNEERAEIGAIYVQQSRFLARRLGAARVARNIARHLEGALSGKPARYRPLIYCWRGGQRSGAMASVLSQIGWRIGVVKGGYKTWRRSVVGALSESNAPLKILLIDGQTGTAKTALLARLAERGVQTIDLEALAAHRGSIFGGWTQIDQPTQKMFESALWAALSRLDLERPIAVEAESNRIGACMAPQRIWRSMLAAPRVVLRADPEARATFLTGAYADLISAPDAVLAAINRLSTYHSKEQIEAWREMVAAREFSRLAASLMREHYDPLYERSRRRRADRPAVELRLDGLGEGDLDAAAREIEAIAARFFERV